MDPGQWPVRFGRVPDETPGPLTSRSPGIAALGPSCTPDRQLGCFVVSYGPTKVLPRPIASWLDVVPAGSWASYQDPPTRKEVQTGHLNRM
jgi:hypothetical protein